MRKIPLIILCFLLYGQTFTQDLPEFLLNPRFNRPGKGTIINYQAGAIELQPGESNATYISSGQSFALTADKEVVTWGRGKELPSIFFNENLSSIFTRHLQFDSFEFRDGLFEWVFTGDKAGFNLSVSGDSIWFYQRYYDSYGFNEPNGNKINLKRHPENIWLLHAIPYTGNLESITLSIDHKMILKLLINCVLVSKQSCLFDVTGHQLRFTGEGPVIMGEMIELKTEDVQVQIDWAERKQKMLGWGGIATPTAYHLLSEEGKALWWEYLVEYNLLLHREYPNGQNLAPDFSNWDKLEDATPHYYGDNFPNGEISDFKYIKKVQELGGISIFEFWKFPPWVQNEFGELDIEAYCEAMLNYCKTAAEQTGSPPAIVGIQNEVTQHENKWHRMTLALRKTLDENGFNEVRIHQQDMGRIENGIQSAKAFTSNDEIWTTIDYAASHVYDYQSHFHDPDRYDSLMLVFKSIIGSKPFLSTEICVNSPAFQTGSYRLAFSMAQLYHKNMTILDASAIMYCWTLLNTVQPSYEASRSLFGVDKKNGFIPYPSSYQLRTFGSWSRRIQKDMYRVEAVSTDPDLLVTAFTGTAGETVVLVNRSQHEINCGVPPAMEAFRYLERTSQYYQNQVEILPGMNENDVFDLKILPGEIITLSSVKINE
jgi:hypothetical protein